MPVGSASWSFTQDDFDAITQTLQRFLYDSNARCALLVDRTGQLVATVGEQPNFDPTAFATLTAADFSANDQLARMLGEPEFGALGQAGFRRADGGDRLGPRRRRDDRALDRRGEADDRPDQRG